MSVHVLGNHSVIAHGDHHHLRPKKFDPEQARTWSFSCDEYVDDEPCEERTLRTCEYTATSEGGVVLSEEEKNETAAQQQKAKTHLGMLAEALADLADERARKIA